MLRLRIALLYQLLHICESREKQCPHVDQRTGSENASVILEEVNIQYPVVYFCEQVS